MYDERSEGLPLYLSVKPVRAAKIEDLRHDPSSHEWLIRTNGARIVARAQNRPRPEIGWYVVFYPDGYVSFSPPEAFEQRYLRVDSLPDA
jgi:hypothetical protein